MFFYIKGMRFSLVSVLFFIFMLLFLGLYIKSKLDVIRISKKLRERVYEDSDSELHLFSSDPWISSLIESINSLLFKMSERRESLDSSYNEIEETLVNISHDLRTPLTSAKGYVELLLDRNLSDDDREILDIVHKRLNVLSRLLEQLFTYTKVHDYRFKLNPCILNLSDVIKETFLEYYNEFESKGIEVILCEEFLLDGNDIEVFQDSKAVDHILYNIIQNALRYANSYLRLYINEVDNRINLVFENDTLYKYSDTTFLKKSYVTGNNNRVDGSSGLGLSIISFYLQKMDGDCEVDYSEGIFRLKLTL